MADPRVFVIWSHPLFHASVRMLLDQSHIELVGATSDHEAAQTQIAALAPEVVIIEETNGGDQASQETIAILRAGPRVIRLSLSNNELSYYRQELHTVARAADLMSLITGESNMNEPTADAHDG